MTLQLFAIMRKNMLALMRSRLSSIVILLGPILLIVFLGLGVQTEFRHVEIGYHLTSNADVADLDAFLNVIKSENIGFEYTSYETSQQCISKVKKGDMHMCIIFAEIGQKTTIYIDVTQSNLAYAILNLISSKFEEKSKQVSTELVREVLNQFVIASSQMQNKSVYLSNIRSNVQDIPLKLEEIRNGLGKFSVDMDYNLKDYDDDFDDAYHELKDYREEIDEQYEINKDRLDEISDNITDSKRSLEDKKRQRDAYIDEIDDEWSRKRCYDREYEDLTPYLEDENLAAVGYSDPECSVLYTLRLQILANTKDIDDSIDMLESMQEMIVEVDGDMDTYRSRARGIISKVEGSLDEAYDTYESTSDVFVTLKKNLQNLTDAQMAALSELSSVSELLNQSMEWMSIVETSLDDISEDFQKMENYNSSALIDPFNTTIELEHYRANRLDYFFSSILVMIISFTCLLLSGLIVVREKQSRAFFRNSIMPLKDSSFLLGILITVVSIGFMQATLILLIAKHAFSLSGLDQMGVVLFISFMACVLFSVVGIVLGTILHSEESAILSGIILSLMLFVFSGIIIPLESMSEFVYSLSYLNPFVMIEIFLQRAMIYNITVFSADLVYVYVVEVVLFLIVGMILFKQAKKRI
jgi:ABC-2 type transport system permease protein